MRQHHVPQIRRFLKYVGKSPHEITEDDIRNYLTRFKNSSVSTYGNVIKAIRRFFRDFLRMGHIVNG